MYSDNELYKKLEIGTVYLKDKTISIEELKWNLHPAFKGVALKHLITGANTNNHYSSHLVKIEPGCEIGLHNHPGKIEMHEVISGKGYGYVEDTEILYVTGIVSYIEADKDHLVKAGDEGLFLLAKFFPALL